jgi:transcriptional regulator
VYVPDHFKPDEADVRELLRNFGSVDLVTATPTGLRSTIIPMVWVEGGQTGDDGIVGLLRGHFARKNDHWQQPVLGEAMVIIRGPDAYITPSWYATKREHGRVVPTWNYITAHVYGDLSIHDDPAFVEANVRALTAKYEAQRNPRWDVNDAPYQFIEGQLRAIVGVEIRITRVDAKFKLSQNRSMEDVEGVVAGLDEDGRTDIATAVGAAKQARRD